MTRYGDHLKAQRAKLDHDGGDMLDFSFVLKGLIIGFSIAAPVGPIGVLCIRRTLAEGRAYGFVSGLGAATADGFYGTVAALGLTLVSAFLIDQANWLRLIGGAYLCYLGVKTFRSQPAPSYPARRAGDALGERAADAKGRGLLGAYTSTLFLTLTNPLTIFAFVAIFAGVGAEAAAGNTLGALNVVLGVFLGSCSWWLILVTLTSLFRSRLNTTGLVWVNRVSGLLILGFGMFILYGLVHVPRA
jgi:threonine/homoserine/homoserine lactone efflux protein